VFDPAQVRELRRTLLSIFEQPLLPGDRARASNGAGLRVELAARYPALRWLLVHRPLLAAVRSILGDDFIYLPEMSAHDSGFGGWHRDTGSQESLGLSFHNESEFAMAQVAIYLQDNHRIYGGGLDVIPRSHAHAFDERSLVGRARRQLQLRTRRHSIPTRAGDLLLFDFRLEHRASQRVPYVPVPPARRKLAVFFACSANNRHAQNYRDYIASRADYEYLHGDHTYPPDLLELASAARLQLMT
jgi:hypothetical protein